MAATLPALRDDAAAKAAALQRLRIELDQLTSEERAVGAKIADLERRLVQLVADIEREGRLIGENGAVLSRLATEDGVLAAEAEGATDRRTEAAARVAAAEANVAQSERLSAEAQAALADNRARRTQIEREISDARARDKRLADEAIGIDRERGSLIGLTDEARLRSATIAVAEAEGRMAAAEASVTKAEAEAVASRAAEASARTAAADIGGRARPSWRPRPRPCDRVLPRAEIANPVAESVTVSDGAEAARGCLLRRRAAAVIRRGGGSYWRADSRAPTTRRCRTGSSR